ncbi:MAG: TonB-dependent receptor [Planctomycetota bacterium]
MFHAFPARLTAAFAFAVLAVAPLVAQDDPILRDLEREAEANRQAADRRQDLQDRIRDLGETVITASRTEELLFDSSTSTDVVGADRLGHVEAPTTIADALRRIPGVMPQKTGPGLGSPFLRGFTGFRTVYLIDGVRLNNSVWRGGPNQYSSTIDPLGLGRLEVVKGPTSVPYGSDAIGGTVGAYTPEVDLGQEGEGWSFGGRAYYRYDTAEDSHVARGEFSGGYGGRFGFRLGGTYSSLGDLEAGGSAGELDNSDWDANAIDAKIRAVASEHVAVEFLFQRVRLNNVPRHHSTADAVTFHGTTRGSDRQRDFDQDRDLVLATVELYDGRFFDEGWVKFGYQNQTEVQDRIRSNGRRDLNGFDLDTVFLLGQLTSQTAIGELTYGFDLYYDWVDSFARRINTDGSVSSQTPPVADRSHYLNLGLFVQDRLELGSWGELVLGVRFQHVALDANEVVNPATSEVFSISDDYQSIVGSARLLVHVTEDLNAFASVGSGFRAPNLSDLTRFDSARTNEISFPTPGLDPEYFVGFEVGARYRRENLLVEAAFFHTLIFDAIDRRPTGAMFDDQFVVVKENVGDGYVQGVELQAVWRFLPDWSLSGQFTWMEGEADAYPTSANVIVEEPVSRIQPITGRAAVEWRPEGTGFRARAEVEIVDNQDKLTSGDIGDTQRIPPGGTPGYAVYNLFFGYEFQEGKTVFLDVLNLSDRQYRVHGSGSQEAGFGARFGFDLRF